VAKKKPLRNRRAAAPGRIATRRKARAVHTTPRRAAGLGPSDRRILDLATGIIEEDQGLLRRLADR